MTLQPLCGIFFYYKESRTVTDFNTYRFGFVGLGLIGGSIARAIRKTWPKAVIIAFNPSADSLREAKADGVVNSGRYADEVPVGHPFAGQDFADCDIVFLCAPVQKNAENLKEIKPYLKENAILTDIGSTKRDIHEHVRQLQMTKNFIGGHPMTGSERTRYRNSRAGLLENAYYILTPEPDASQDKVEVMTELVQGMRALPIVVPCEKHDYTVGAISHVPHVISAALVNLVKNEDSEDQLMKMLAAGGFKDITRISSSSPVMWEQICLTNGDNIVKLLDDYIASLTTIRNQIENKDGESIFSFFDSARHYRDSFNETGRGSIQPLYTIHVDIADRPAALAEVVTLLAVNAISIKNVGITHNREYAEGVLLVEFYTENDRKKAAEILTTRGFHIHL